MTAIEHHSSIPGETRRKLVHISFGFAALALRWLTWEQAAAVAVAAFLFNWLVLPRVGGRAIARSSRGYDVGILLYPLAVLALVIVFRHRLEIAGAIWAIIAFGDGVATLAGKAIGGPRLPWNRSKSVAGTAAFVLFGAGAAVPISMFVGVGAQVIAWPLAVVAATVVAAIVESIHTAIDDNLTVPVSASFVMYVLAYSGGVAVPQLASTDWIWLAVNAGLAVAGYLAKSVDVSGMVGGFILGAILIICAGWPLYAVLLAFFVIGSGLTKAGYRRKLAQGLAQEKGGRRGASHAFANVGMAALLALAALALPQHAVLLYVAAAASMATAAADTTGSEVGQWLGRRTFLPLSLQPVPRGTEGAISVEGTLAGLVSGAVVAAIAVWTGDGRTGELDPVRAFASITVAAFVGSYLESVIGSFDRKRATPIPNGVMNFLNTAIGAAVAGVMYG